MEKNSSFRGEGGLDLNNRTKDSWKNEDIAFILMGFRSDNFIFFLLFFFSIFLPVDFISSMNIVFVWFFFFFFFLVRVIMKENFDSRMNVLNC